jgi:hypothetical protein
MLDHAGLKTWYLLVHSASDGYFDPNFFSWDQLQAPAVRVRLDTVDYVVFPYMPSLPADHVPDFFQGQAALQISEGIADLWKIPEGNRANNRIDEHYDLEINASGSIKVVENRVVGGFAAYEIRETLRGASDAETGNILRGMLPYTGGLVTLDSSRVRNAEAYKQPLEIDLYYTLENLVTTMPDEVVFQTGGLFSPISDLEGELTVDERQNPIRVNFNQQHDKRIDIRIPAGWKLVTELPDISFESDFGTINGRYETSEGLIAVEQRVTLNRASADKTRAADLAALIGRRSHLDVPALVFALDSLSAPSETGVDSDGGAGEEMD